MLVDNRFANMLEEIVAGIDKVFGSGYARANPALVDRLLAQEFKASRGASRILSALRAEPQQSPVLDAVLCSLRSGAVAEILPTGERYFSSKAVTTEVAAILKVKKTRSLETIVGRILANLPEGSPRQVSSRSGGVRKRSRGIVLQEGVTNGSR